jgi:hypothetical protein
MSEWPQLSNQQSVIRPYSPISSKDLGGKITKLQIYVWTPDFQAVNVRFYLAVPGIQGEEKGAHESNADQMMTYALSVGYPLISSEQWK